VQATSDEFFARDDALAVFPEGRVDLAFVDGLHLVEFALRDFINVERHTDWTSVIVLDGVLPRGSIEAARERGEKRVWTGDVFNVGEVLARYRASPARPAGMRCVDRWSPWSARLHAAPPVRRPGEGRTTDATPGGRDASAAALRGL
jgi:hypothetical protein